MADREFFHVVDKCTSEKWFQKIKPFQQMWAFLGLCQVFPCVHACKAVCCPLRAWWVMMTKKQTTHHESVCVWSQVGEQQTQQHAAAATRTESHPERELELP
jgi:hypothetical protein